MDKPNKTKQITIIAPFDLAEWLEKQAAKNRRSVSAEGVVILEMFKMAEVQ
jgi:hypothetical protein